MISIHIIYPHYLTNISTLWQHQSVECKLPLLVVNRPFKYHFVFIIHLFIYSQLVYLNIHFLLLIATRYVDTHSLTLLIVLVIAPLTAYLYNRFIHQCMKARCIDTKRRMSQSTLGRRMSLEGVRRRMSRFSTKRSSMSEENNG